MYFIGQPPLTPIKIKIGFTNGDPRTRLCALKYQLKTELELLAVFAVPQVQQAEQALHARLAVQCLGSEWYPVEVGRTEIEKMRQEAPPWTPEEPTWNREIISRFRAAPEEVEHWRRLAEQAGMSLSGWIRQKLNARVRAAEDT